MDKTGKIILVTGATGKQGGAVVKHLLKDGWKLRALVRDENKPAAQELKKQGVELIKGDMEDTASLDKAMAGVYGVFSVQNFWEHGYDGELSQGKKVADAAKKAGVKHFVYSSVASANKNTNLPHFDVKFEIENYIKSLGLPYTILRPVFFMENLSTWFKPTEADGKTTLSMALKTGIKLQMIAVDDIGGIVAMVFDNPEKYLGKEIDLAGDELTLPQMADVFSKSLGKKVEPYELPVDVLRSGSKETGDMFQWFNDKGYEADIKNLKTIYPGLTDFENWLKSNK